jgi:C1A family cysteine protease
VLTFAQPSQEWIAFKNTFSKTYGSAAEETLRSKIFHRNLETIAKLNERGTATFGVNKFADLSPREFKSKYLNFRPHPYVEAPLFEPNAQIASAENTIDWRTKGAITPVKDQGQCGSCWAFSAVEETESMSILAGNPLQKFSVQQVVSCDTVDAACNGGDTPTAYEYIKSAGGLEAEKTYPYTSGMGQNGTCLFNKAELAGGNNNGFTWASPACKQSDPHCKNVDEAKLLTSLGKAPISICVKADPWQFYESGVMHHKDCDGDFADLDHCVQLVGYNSDAKDGKYWIIRNSWGSDWALDGYIWVQYGYNTCGVADEATIVTIAK